MSLLDDTTTVPELDNDDDKIMILDGNQRQEYFSNIAATKKHKGILNISVKEVFKRLRR